MPELPEVDVVRQGLEPAITGALIEHVEILDPRSLRRHQGPQEEFVHTLEGARIHAVARRGKFLWFLLENSTGALVCHLGMSGQVRLGTPESDFGPHLRIR
ncbi:MAG: DNA-formamidopyrimidine glycosylase, partial [Microbacteriaceae bacterium]|nr:DNA-formamidopyrimidine glycosylase [Microbacteriaceae bacterium]